MATTKKLRRALLNVEWPHWETEALLAAGSFALFAFATITLLFHKVEADNEKYIMLLLGALIGVVKDTFGRYLQATKGAQEQRREAATVAQTLAETAAKVAGK